MTRASYHRAHLGPATVGRAPRPPFGQPRAGDGYAGPVQAAQRPDCLGSVVPSARTALHDLIERGGCGVAVVAASRDPNAKVTVLVTPPGSADPTLAIKVPTTDLAERAVEREAQTLVRLRRMRLREVEETIPRYVATVDTAGRRALVTTAVSGVPMLVDYHSFRHTARRDRVRADFSQAGAWLAALHRASAGERARADFLTPLLPRLAERMGQSEGRTTLLAALDGVARELRSVDTPRTVVHGDFWCGNVLRTGDRVSGVVDWEAADCSGEPLRDLARFAVSYALYLDRHTRHGHRVVGHERLRAGQSGDALRYGVAGSGWFPALLREFVSAGLRRLGAADSVWRAVLLAGIAEVVSTADHPAFAEEHLRVLSDLLAATGPS